MATAPVRNGGGGWLFRRANYSIQLRWQAAEAAATTARARQLELPPAAKHAAALDWSI